MKKPEMMFFSERMAFAEALTKWRDQQMREIGWKVKDMDRMKMNYMDCITLLEGLGLIDIEKGRQFIADMRGKE